MSCSRYTGPHTGMIPLSGFFLFVAIVASGSGILPDICSRCCASGERTEQMDHDERGPYKVGGEQQTSGRESFRLFHLISLD